MILTSVPIGRLGTSAKAFRMQGILGCIVASSMMLAAACLPTFWQYGVNISGYEKRVVHLFCQGYMFIISGIFGIGSVLFSCADLGLSLKMLPDGVGNGAAMSIT